MAGFVLLLHVVGWGVLVLAVAPHDYRLGSTGVLGVGVGLTAYMLGVRHAFDADHIASIDNTTRKLVGEGRSSVSAGFWFSLGHSSVVFAASLLLVAGVRSVADAVQGGDSRLAATLAEMYRHEIDATGQPMSPEPYAAIKNAIEHYRVDDILISTLKGEQSKWLEEGLIERVQGLTDLPVEHIESGTEPASSSAAEPAAVGAGEAS